MLVVLWVMTAVEGKGPLAVVTVYVLHLVGAGYIGENERRGLRVFATGKETTFEN